jgi:hypothetical protein
MHILYVPVQQICKFDVLLGSLRGIPLLLLLCLLLAGVEALLLASLPLLLLPLLLLLLVSKEVAATDKCKKA